MNITVKNLSVTQSSSSCNTSENIDGELLSNESSSHHSFKHYSLTKDNVFLVDTCDGICRVKSVAEKYSYCLIEDYNKLKEIAPFAKSLQKRKILILTNPKMHSQPKITEEVKAICKKSFYDDSGNLINQTFEAESISPEKMADNGMMFVGDQTCDRITCYHANPQDNNHKFIRWDNDDIPMNEHLKHLGYYACLPPMTHDTQCKLVDSNGAIINEGFTSYQLIVHTLGEEKTFPVHHCNDSTIIKTNEKTLTTISSQQLSDEIREIKIEKLRKLLESNELSKEERSIKTIEAIKLIHFDQVTLQWSKTKSEFLNEINQFISAHQSHIELVNLSIKIHEDLEKLQTQKFIDGIVGLTAQSCLINYMGKQLKEILPTEVADSAIDAMRQKLAETCRKQFIATKDKQPNQLTSDDKGLTLEHEIDKAEKSDNSELTKTLRSLQGKLDQLLTDLSEVNSCIVKFADLLTTQDKAEDYTRVEDEVDG